MGKPQIVELEGGYRLRVSSDEMEAWLEGPSGDVSYEEFCRLKDRLEALGLQNILDPPLFREDRLVVAIGKSPENGEDGRIEFLVDFSQGPKEVSSHRVDWREINALVSLPPGAAVARVHPPSPGIPGFTVWGKPIPPKPGRRIRIKVEAKEADALLDMLEKELGELEEDQGAGDLILGPGLKYVVEEGLVVTQEGGIIELKGRRLLLHSIYTLKGDVDWHTGNIRFHGKKLVITGSVRRGFKVFSEGDLVIKGNIEDNVTISVKGNLFVSGLIKGEDLEISVDRDAFLHIVEYATLKIKGSLSVNSYLLQTTAIVGGMLSVTGDKGVIGGEVYVEGSATVSVAGSPAFVKTWIKVGYNYFVAEEVEKLEKEFSRLDEITDQLKNILVYGIRLAKAGKLSPEKKEILKKMHSFLKEKLLEMADIKEKIVALEKHLDQGEYATLQITFKAYPNVIVGIGKYVLPLRKEYGPGVFCWERKRIVFRGSNP